MTSEKAQPTEKPSYRPSGPMSMRDFEKLKDSYPLLKYLKKMGYPLTRAEYLELVFAGGEPFDHDKPLDIEVEVELPPPFRHPSIPEATER